MMKVGRSEVLLESDLCHNKNITVCFAGNSDFFESESGKALCTIHLC